MKTGILIVSFGTSYKKAREDSLLKIEKEIADRFQDCYVYCGFTSSIVIRKIKEQEGLSVFSPTEALKQMKADKVNRVLVLPTHLIPGIENEKLKRAVEACMDEFEQITVAPTLMETKKDCEQLCDKLLSIHDIGKEDCHIFMGHGTKHRANEQYEILQQCFWDKDYEHVLLAYVEPESTIDQVISRLKEEHWNKEVIISPLMVAAGDHVQNDMAGEGEDSFASKLKQAGFQINCKPKGLGELEAFREMYIERISSLLEEQ